MTVVDGKKLAEDMLAELHERVSHLSKAPELVGVLVGHNAASVSFLNEKRKACEKIGIVFTLIQYDEHITTTQLRGKLSDVRQRKRNAAFLIQLPLPQQLNTQYILDSIPSEQDPDMLSARSWGLLVTGKATIVPPTAGAVLHILKAHNIELKKAHCVLVGWGLLVGKPLSLLLADEVASLSIVQSTTPDAAHFTREADVLIAGTGKAGLITGAMLKQGVVAIDAGYSKIDGKICGDLDYASVAGKAALITPVPGGVGPLTVAILLKNVVTLIENH